MNTSRSKAYLSTRRYGPPRDNLTLDAIDAERAGMHTANTRPSTRTPKKKTRPG